jgi:hypothetical protein
MKDLIADQSDQFFADVFFPKYTTLPPALRSKFIFCVLPGALRKFFFNTYKKYCLLEKVIYASKKCMPPF